MHTAFKYEETVVEQLRAMGMSRFDLRIVSPRGHVMEQRDELFLNQVKDIIEWLHEKNSRGNTIEVRPHGEHGMTLVTGLDYQQVQQARLNGFEPAVTVACGPDCYQLWLKHDRKLSADPATLIALHICKELGGDCSNSQWDSYGYLAGFTIPAGEQRFSVQLVSHSGEVFSQSKKINDELAQPR